MAFKIKNWGGSRRGQRVKEAGEDVNRENGGPTVLLALLQITCTTYCQF